MTISLKSEQGLNQITVSSRATLEDIVVFSRENMSSLQGKPSLWDFEAFDVSAVNTKTVSAYIQKTIRINQPRRGDKAAHFASRDDIFGLLRMYQQLRELDGKVIVGIFRSRQEALDWLAD